MSYQDTIDQLEAVMAPLASWRDDPDVVEIAINRPGEAFVHRKGKFECHPVDLNYDDCYDIAVLAAALRRQTVGENSPIVGSDIPHRGHLQRLQAMLPDTVPAETVSLTLRCFEDKVAPVEKITSRYDTSRWNKWADRYQTREADFAEALHHYDTGDIEAFLRASIKSRMNTILVGPTASGKTTLARSMAGVVDQDERIITIEDALELVLPHKNCVRLLYSQGGLNANGVTPTDLLQAALRMKPDRIIFQELRDKESAYVYLSEGMTGHPGSITTTHGSSAADGFKRIFDLVKGSHEGRGMSDSTVIGLLDNVIDVIIPLRSFGGHYSIREVFFAADAARRAETAASLMGK